MSVQVRRRRESAAFLATYVGAQAELLVDTTNYRVQVHDGATAGGFPAAKLSEVVTNTRTAVTDANYSAAPGDRTIAITSLTAARIISLPAAAIYPTGTRLAIVDESGACALPTPVTIAAAGSDMINGLASVVLAKPYAMVALTSDGVSRWTIVDQAFGPAAVAPVRQTVATGPVAGGLPNLFPATAASLSLSTQGISGASPLIVTAAAGYTAAGANDLVFACVTNLTFALAANATNYLYIDAATGTPGATTLAPIYQTGGTPATANGQFTFDIQRMAGALGNGTGAGPSTLVFVGEATTNAGAVVGTVTYAYNGIFDTGYLGALPAAGATLSRTHNLGFADAQVSFTAKCLAAEGGYAAGHVLRGLMVVAGGGTGCLPLVTSRLSVLTIAGSTPGGFAAINLNSGALFTLTASKWAPRLIVRRGWGGA